jgi:multiple antibiotic resistance protein
MIKENLDDLASEIALPFMVGAGTISLSILLSEKHSLWIGAILLIVIFGVNFFVLFLLKKFRDSIKEKMENGI